MLQFIFKKIKKMLFTGVLSSDPQVLFLFSGSSICFKKESVNLQF